MEIFMNSERETMNVKQKSTPIIVIRIEFKNEEANCKRNNQLSLEIIQGMFCDHLKSECYKVREA